MLINYIKPDFVHQDERGGLYQLVSKGFNQVNYIYSKADMVRGGHFHKINKEIFEEYIILKTEIEIFFVIRGLFRLVLESNNEKEVYMMKTGDFFEIEKGIKHTFEYIEDTELISLYDLGVELENDEKDIYR